MLSNDPLDLYRQLVDCLEHLRTALDMRDFEALTPLVKNQACLITRLHNIEDQVEGIDTELLAQAHFEVVQLIAQAKRQQAELGREISTIGNKNRHIAVYRRNQR